MPASTDGLINGLRKKVTDLKKSHSRETAGLNKKIRELEAQLKAERVRVEVRDEKIKEVVAAVDESDKRFLELQRLFEKMEEELRDFRGFMRVSRQIFGGGE